MRKYLSVLMLATLAACSGDDTKDATDATDAGDDDDDACANSIIAQFPIADDSDVYYKTDVRFSLAAADEGATITVTDDGGAAVNGSTTVDGTTVIWSGDDLAPSTHYNATLTYECGDATVGWTTSSTGSPVSGTLAGSVYNLDIANGEWVRPAGIGDLLAVELEDTEILVSPTAEPGATIEFLGAVGDGSGGQDLCIESLPFPPANWADPYFEIETPALDLDIEGYSFTIEDLVLSGAFAPDGSRIQGTVFQGFVDTRPLVDLLVPGGDEDSVCELTLTFGVPCEECTGGGTFCLSVYVDSVNADKVGTSGLQVVTAADIAANGDCATTP